MSLNNDDIKSLISILQKLVENNTQNDEAQPTTNKTTNIKQPTSKRGRQIYREHTNTFVDMPERNMHKDDTEIDKKLSKFPPTPRNRPVSMIDVMCRVCGKRDTISSKMLPESADRYKCNNCSTSGG